MGTLKPKEIITTEKPVEIITTEKPEEIENVEEEEEIIATTIASEEEIATTVASVEEIATTVAPVEEIISVKEPSAPSTHKPSKLKDPSTLQHIKLIDIDDLVVEEMPLDQVKKAFEPLFEVITAVEKSEEIVEDYENEEDDDENENEVDVTEKP